MFTDKDPGGNRIVIRFNARDLPGSYGTTISPTELEVYTRAVTDPRKQTFFPTQAEQTATFLDVAAHELGHVLMPGYGHNRNAPATADPVSLTISGKTYTIKRTPGDGMLVNGRPGLMASGNMVLPTELAQDQMQFTDREKMIIAQNLEKQQAGKATDPGPQGPKDGKLTDLLMILGQRFNFDDPNLPSGTYPPQPTDNIIDLKATLHNSTHWDFGFVTRDGGFTNLIDAGLSQGTLGFMPGSLVNFAIRSLGGSDDQRLSLADIGVIDGFSAPVSGSLSADPVFSGTYYQAASLRFHPDANPADDVTVLLQTDGVDPSNGFVAVLEPEPTSLVLLVIGDAGACFALRGRCSIVHRRSFLEC
jgi:hypothetical protein